MSSWLWPWIGSYCILSCITHRPLTMYVWTGGRTFETHFIISTPPSWPNNDINVMLFTNIKYSNIATKASHKKVFCYLFSVNRCILCKGHLLWCVQFMATTILRDQQYMFGAKGLLMAEKCHEEWPDRHVISVTYVTVPAVNSLTEMDIFWNRIINAWNSLSDDVVASPTVACFKHRLANFNFTL